jgi:hypothetical protein
MRTPPALLTEQERESMEQQPISPHEVIPERLAYRTNQHSPASRKAMPRTDALPRERLVVRRVAVRREARDEHRAVAVVQELRCPSTAARMSMRSTHRRVAGVARHPIVRGQADEDGERALKEEDLRRHQRRSSLPCTP